MLVKKLFRTMKLYKAQFLSMILMIALGVGVFVGFNMEWASIERNVQTFFDKTGYADYRIVSEAGFSEDDLQKICAVAGVRKAARFLSVSAGVKEHGEDSVALTVTTDPAVCGFLVTEGAPYDAQSTDSIWLSDRYAAANGIVCGDTLSFTYKNLTITGKVAGLIKSGEYLVCVRDETQLMPDFDTHGFAYISPAFYRQVAGAEYYPYLNVLSDLEKKEFLTNCDRALGKTTLVLTHAEMTSSAAADGEAQEGKTMGSVLPVLFLLIAVLTMVTTMHRLTAKEKTQIGTLKALGYRDKRILLHYTSYALMIGGIGSVLGVGLGCGIAYWIMNPNGTMGTYFDMPEWKLYLPGFCYLILAGILALLTFIGFLSVKQMLAGSAADALRPYTPKKVKPLAVEKTKWFHRLSFGTRWNLRDCLRHKSRTAMSLIGIVGCMILMVGSLGMGDTMDAFLDLYYNGATNYVSKISLSEDATSAQRAEVIERYQADSSASVSVQIEEKAVSLDIYAISHDKVRFPAQKSGYVKLENNGAYICMRIAREYGLKVGDSLTISPFGTDQQYHLTVAGIIRSVSESIVISETYAQEIGIPYTMDSVYTDARSDEIAPNDAIRSVQSKQKIMESFDSFTEIMDMMIFVLIFGALILGVVVLYNLGVMSYTERYREMATLKVVGFRDRKIGTLLIGQNLWLSLIGILIGLPAGIGTLGYLLRAMAGEYEMKLAISVRTVLISICLTVGMSLVVSLIVSRKNKKIDMVEALKGTE